jgi:hypothetical protein
MTARERKGVAGWQAWVRSVALRPEQGRTAEARGARVAEPARHAWRAHLADVVARRG